jgi:hypothetical protein
VSRINDAELRRRLELLAGVQPSPEAAQRALERVRGTLLDKDRLLARKSIGRILMNSRWSKLAVAATIVVAVLIGLEFLGPSFSKVTFARAIQPILNANTAILDLITGPDVEGAPVIHDMIMGSRIRRTVPSVEDVVSIIDLESSRVLDLNESKKKATYIDLKGLPQIPNYLDQLKNLLTEFQDNPRLVVEELGTKEVDGRAAVGFCAKHPQIEITLWADAQTGLPLRIEEHAGQMVFIVKNLQFNVPMDEALFSMEVPAGYTLQETQLDLFGSTEADFIEGLRVRAEMFGDGQFPESMALEDYIKQAPDMIKKTEQLKLSPEQETELEKKMGQHLLFLRMFKGEGKWYYRGQGVKLGEAQTPIFWYRPKDSKTYRVIYGDLHVADVPPENLPEPLAADDVPPVSLGFQQWSKPDFVGTQEDLWRITASGQILVQSDVTLMKGPQGTSIMPITLPYATGVLTSVAVGDTPVPFEPTGAGQYELQLPLDKLLAGQTKVTCTWTLVLDDLELAGNNVPLKSLVPVVSYKLSVALDPDSGWEYVKDPSQSSWVPFSIGNPPKPMTDFSVCGLGLHKRK